MRIKVEAYFRVSVWDKKFLLLNPVVDWKKGTITDQGLDRIGDSYWISGIHVGTSTEVFSESSTGVQSPISYSSQPSKDDSYIERDSDVVAWVRDMQFRFSKQMILDQAVSEVSLSWDQDHKTASALVSLPAGITISDTEDLVVEVRVKVIEDLNSVKIGEIDLGASLHTYTIKPCYYTKYKDAHIGSPLTQKEGRVYSGHIPSDPAVEPEGGIDTNLAVFGTYLFESRSKTFTNFFTLSSPNAVTRTATSHTFGLPSAYAVEFDPPIDKDFNRELTLNFKINWDRG